jgi:hypothetical protein
LVLCAWLLYCQWDWDVCFVGIGENIVR